MYNLVDIHFHTNDSLDAYEEEKFDVEEVISVLKDEDESKFVKLLCKTDHNILNFENYLMMSEKFASEGITLLPGIEINAQGNIHWVFIFDLCIEQGIPEYDDYHGQTLDNRIIEYFNYDKTNTKKSLQQQAKEAQNKEHDLKKFIAILHDLNIPYIAIPHLNKSKGWYDKLKKDKNQLKIVEEFLNSNVINGFESKNQDAFIYEGINETEKHIKELKEEFDSLESTLSEKDKNTKIQEVNRRIKHLSMLNELHNSLSNDDIAIICGSDFHCRKGEIIEDYRKYKNKLFYIKADNTFEGLRISLLDQYSRVFSSTKKNNFSKNAITCIDKLELTVNGKDVTMQFGDGLNSIIGSRGTGKSYFLNLLIGNTSKYDKSQIYKDIQLRKIIFANGDEKQTLDVSDYDILKQRGTTATDDENKNSIYELLADAPYNKEVYLREIEKFTQNIVKSEQIEPDIKDLNHLFDLFVKIDSFRCNSMSFSYIKEFNEFYKNKSDNGKIYDLFTNVRDFLISEQNRIKTNLHYIQNAEEHIDELQIDFDKIEQIKETTALYINFEEEKNILIKTKEDKLEKIKKTIIAKEKKYFSIQEKIWKSLDYLQKNSTNTENVLKQHIEKLKEFVLNTVKLLKEVRLKSEELQERFQEKRKDEKIYKIALDNESYFIKTVTELDFLNMDINICQMLFDKYRCAYQKDTIKNCLNPTDYGKWYISKIYELRDKRCKDYRLYKPDLNQQLFLNFNDEEYKNWANLSPGERADKLLDVALKGSTGKILLIDQPEDDLDNETIYKSLVSKIRELKLRRQIIIVTHNANIAIVGDSDKFIVCQNSNNKFSCFSDGMESQKLYNYSSINSNIENKKILIIAAKILDGGKEALRKRVRKIGYKDIFYKEKMNESNIR